MRFRNWGLLVALMMLFVVPAYALDLYQARASGLVGERLDGYITARKDSPEVQAFVIEVNTKRRQEYARISQENNQSLEIVAKFAAEQIINNLEPGVYYQALDGSWKQR